MSFGGSTGQLAQGTAKNWDFKGLISGESSDQTVYILPVSAEGSRLEFAIYKGVHSGSDLKMSDLIFYIVALPSQKIVSVFDKQNKRINGDCRIQVTK